jgi:phosphate-selective porin
VNDSVGISRRSASGTAVARPPLASALLAALLGLPAATATAGDWTFDGLALKNKQADFELKLSGYIQFDFRSFDWEVEDPAFRADSADLRRARAGVELQWKRLSAEFDVDWTQPGRDWIDDNEPPYLGAEVKDAYAQYEFAKAFVLRAGAFKPPVSYEFLTSAGRTDFVERGQLALSMAPDRDWGVEASGEVGRFDYLAGVFAGDGRVSDARAGTTFVARVVASPWKPLDVGASFSRGEVEAAPDGPGTDPSPKGFRGQSPSGWRWYERKFVAGARTRWGFDSQYTRGGFQLKGEFLQGREEREGQGSTFQDLPTQVGTGWSATASYVLTGERKQRSLKPKRPLTKGGPGLIEVGVKWDYLRFDDADDDGFEGAGNRARNLRPARDEVLWGGVLWMPAEWMRLQGDVYRESYLDPLLAPEPPLARFVSGTPKGQGPYWSFVARVQFLIP